jgi:hypothetical protein
MRSSPQAGLSLAISTISFWSSAGMRGRPRGLDFHFQNNRKPCGSAAHLFDGQIEDYVLSKYGRELPNSPNQIVELRH